MAVALKSQDVRGDAVKEPTIVTDYYGAAGKFFKRLFKRPQSVHIKIIRWLIKQQQIGTAFQHLCQMHTVAFTTRELADLLLLVASLKIELADIGAGRYRTLSKFNLIKAI